jgi:hypothetical protein
MAGCRGAIGVTPTSPPVAASAAAAMTYERAAGCIAPPFESMWPNAKKLTLRKSESLHDLKKVVEVFRDMAHHVINGTCNNGSNSSNILEVSA